jgi:hypothetical protein
VVAWQKALVLRKTQSWLCKGYHFFALRLQCWLLQLAGRLVGWKEDMVLPP